MFRNIVKDRPDLAPERLERTRTLMTAAIRDVMVFGWEELADGLSLPDPNDRHVLAAAVRCNAQCIVTFNLRDFPAATLSGFGVEAAHPDEFVLDLLDLAPGAVLRALTEQAAGLRNPAVSLPDLLTVLETNGLRRSAAECRRRFGLNVPPLESQR